MAHLTGSRTAPAQPPTESELAVLRAQIDARAEALHAQMIDLRHHLHAHPELSNREVQTAALLAGILRDAGFDEVREGVGGNGVVGILRGGAPGDRVIALRADMDALPVKESSGVPFASAVVDAAYPSGPFPVAHACGHDCHMSVVATTARLLAGMRDLLPGTVMIVFQPAEEGPPIDEAGGAQAMLDDGAFADPQPTMVFGMHVGPGPRGMVGYRRGNAWAASCLVRIRVSGMQAHGSSPWLGRDPLPAAAEIITGSAQLYRKIRAQNAVTVSFGHVDDIGRFNILGEHVTLWGTLRCVDESDMDALQTALRRLAENYAAAHECEADVRFLQNVPPVRNAPEWIDALLPTLVRVAGADALRESPAGLGYDDMSVFVNAGGGAYLSYGVQDTEYVNGVLRPIEGGRGLGPNHNPTFYADDGALLGSLRIHAHVALDHLLGLIEPTASP